MCSVSSIDCDGTPNGLTRKACTRATATRAMRTSVNRGRRRRRRVVGPSGAGASAVTRVTLVRPRDGCRFGPGRPRCEPCRMVSVVLGMLFCVALALVVVALVAVPARRAGRDVLTERGEEVVGSIRERQLPLARGERRERPRTSAARPRRVGLDAARRRPRADRAGAAPGRPARVVRWAGPRARGAPPVRSGIDPAAVDPDVRPQDDLFAHVNGRWLATTPIPAGPRPLRHLRRAARDGRGARARHHRGGRGRRPRRPGTVAAKVGDLYASFMDEDAVEALGVGPAGRRPRRASAALGHGRRLVARPGALHARRRPRASSSRSSTPTTATPAATSSTSSRPASACPTRRTTARTRTPTTRAAYVGHVERMLAPRRLARPRRARPSGSWPSRPGSPPATGTRSTNRDPVSDVQPRRPRRPRRRWRPGVDWDALPRAASAPPDEAFDAGRRAPARPPALDGRRAGRASRSQAWRDWLAWHVVHAHAPYLSAGVRRGELRLLRPHPVRRPRDARALEAGRRPRRGGAGRGGRAALRRAALPAAGQGAHGRARRQPRRGLPAAAWRSRAVDGRRHPARGARQARPVHAEDRLPRPLARLLGPRDRARRPARQRAPGRRVRGRPPARQARRARSTATSGS